MYQIYHAPFVRSSRLIWLCEELGVPYEAIMCSLLDIPPRVYELNPSGTLPVFIDGDRVITESIVAMEYIAAGHGPTDLVVSPGQPEYWDYRQWLMFGEATLSAPLNGVVGTTFRAPDDQKRNFTEGLIRELFRKRLRVVSKHLAGREYMAAGRFTLADISVAYPISLALKVEILGLKDDIPPDLAAYAGRLTSRPAFRRMATVR